MSELCGICKKPISKLSCSVCVACAVKPSAAFTKGVNAEHLQTKEKIGLLIARSVFELLPARMFSEGRERAAYYLGVRETEEAWHKLLEDLKKELGEKK